ncbi:MAG: methyltransferase domain-containing protein [Bdellovibrionales bacterium]|nr:methyltransferase domain-containing protein [Bdellovibrionales bacterium]
MAEHDPLSLLFHQLASIDYLQGYDFEMLSPGDEGSGRPFALHPRDKTLRKAENILRLLPPDLSGERVLDIGCNKGFFSFECVRRNAREVLGLETIPAIVEVLQTISKASPIFDGARFECRGFSTALAAEGPFDTILFCSSYHYVYAELRSHEAIFATLARLQPKRVILELPLETDDAFAWNHLTEQLQGEQLKAYNVHAILHAASLSFGSVRYIANSGFLRTRDIFLLEVPGASNPYRYEWEQADRSALWSRVRP